MPRHKGGRALGLRCTALAAALAVCGGMALRLCGPGLPHWQPGRAGVFGLALAAAPAAVGGVVLDWLAPALAAQPGDALPVGTGTAGARPTADGPGPPADSVGQDPAGTDGISDPNGADNGSENSAAAPGGDAGTADRQTAGAPLSPPAAGADIPADWLPVQQVHYPAAGEGERYIPLAAGSIRNLTAYAAAEVQAAATAGGLPFAVALNAAEPQVLIMHTHTTECYAETAGFVSPANNGRTTDAARNMAAVGAVLADTLNAAGICTVQDTTMHDYPSYNGSYGRSLATVQQWLTAYPSIKVVLDVHRDAIETDGVRMRPIADINGANAAQLMIICGADDGTMGMPDFWQNLRFAAALQAATEADWPGLTRPLLFDYRNYNQQLTTGSLLLEVGGHGNTLEEAMYTARLVGQSLAALLTENAA